MKKSAIPCPVSQWQEMGEREREGEREKWRIEKNNAVKKEDKEL